MQQSVFAALRKEYHQKICSGILGCRGSTGIYSNADVGNRASLDLAARLVAKLGLETCLCPPKAQGLGLLFTQYTREFIRDALHHLAHVRPGTWIVPPNEPSIVQFVQYEHLAELQRLAKTNRELAAALGEDYLVNPDIVVARRALDDVELNREELLVVDGEDVAKLTPLRLSNNEGPKLILHASISCKWTVRSDRVQNTRTEALNLIRNRKGKAPHVVAVTMEPLPTRLAAIALGTGDMDCTYHAALYELMEATQESTHRDQAEKLDTLVKGHRLRDVSDLPFDLVT